MDNLSRKHNCQWIRRFAASSFVVLLTSYAAVSAFSQTTEISAYRIAPFSVDVTIPLNHRCMGVLPGKSQVVDDPLYAHGFVLLGPDDPLAVVAVDWCEIRNGAYDQWRDALAKASGTTRERILLSCLHQHDAPVVDSDAARLLAEVGLRGELYDESFHDETLRRVADALQKSLTAATPVTHISTGQAHVEGIASSRRVVRNGNQVSFDRGSRSGGDAFMASADEGRIDPMLRTIAFWNNDQPLVALSSYATHPMSRYGEGRISADFVGLARARRQAETPSMRQIYVSGCSGDVTAGKYNDGSDTAREQLIQRLHDGMKRAWTNQTRTPIQRIVFRRAPLELEFHPDETLTLERLSRVLGDDQQSTEARILAAMGLASRQRVAKRQPIDIVALDFGTASILLLPGESFVAYQQWAQSLRPTEFVMSIGYGECWPGYIPTDDDFQNGFSDKWLWVAAGSEARMHAAIRAVLGQTSEPSR